MAEIDEILQEFIDDNRDVTFPIHYEDRLNIPSTFVPFGFSASGNLFTREWMFSFETNARIVASFTGVLFVHVDPGTGEKFILIRSFAQRPLNAISGLPSWYPIPQYAKYGPFQDTDINEIIRDLFTDDESRISFLTGGIADDVEQRLEENVNRVATVEAAYRGQLQDAAESPTAEPMIVQAVNAIVAGNFNSGIPLAAGTELIQFQPGTDLRFSLHPADVNQNIVSNLYFDPHNYFYRWRNKIEQYGDFPSSLRTQVLAPPISTGNVVYVKSISDPGFPTAHVNLEDAISAANVNDIILILDHSTYDARVVVPKYLSIIGLVPADNNVTLLDANSDAQLDVDLPGLYPVVTNSVGKRGIQIWYDESFIQDHGLVYLRNIAVMNNHLDTMQEVRLEFEDDPEADAAGGAGILVNGEYYGSLTPPPTTEFCKAHIHNCAIYKNEMTGFPEVEDPPSADEDSGTRIPPPGLGFCGGGILCYISSPMITQCLIRKNTSYFHGGGIGVYRYGFPFIVENAISYNTAMGHPFSDFDHGPKPGGNGDGGGIGVFQAYPNDRDDVQVEMAHRIWDNLHDLADPTDLTDLTDDVRALAELVDYIRTRLPQAWDAGELRKAKSTWIRISQNHIHHNSAYMSGGGVYGTVISLLTLWNNRIEYNTALHQDGGGIACTYGSRLVINGTGTSDNFIQHNTSHRNGGGIYIRSSKAAVNHCCIRDNNGLTSSSIDGGGVAVLSIAEIQPPLAYRGYEIVVPLFDIIRQVIFDHIDKVEFIGRDIDLDGNAASRGQDAFALKDAYSYDGRVRTLLVGAGLINILEIHVKIETNGSVRGTNVEFFNKGILGIEHTISPSYFGAPGSEFINNTY